MRKRSRSQLGDKLHLDEVFIRIEFEREFDELNVKARWSVIAELLIPHYVRGSYRIPGW